MRCSGTYPCETCVREEVTCEGIPPSVASPLNDIGSNSAIATPAHEDRSSNLRTHVIESRDSSRAGSCFNDAPPSRRNSLEPPQTFAHGNHVGPTSGVSFLYGQWNKSQTTDPSRSQLDEESVLSQAPIVSYGDLPQLDAETLSTLPEPKFTIDVILDILERYFQYISPTYRFHHHPTVKKWAIAYVNQDRQLSSARKACVLLICAQTLLHSPVSPGVAQVGRGDVAMSMACSERAKAILDHEPGPPSLASVQCRIGTISSERCCSKAN